MVFLNSVWLRLVDKTCSLGQQLGTAQPQGVCVYVSKQITLFFSFHIDTVYLLCKRVIINELIWIWSEPTEHLLLNHKLSVWSF